MEELNNALAEINVAMPATIVSYNAGNQWATVKPSLAKRLSNGNTLQAPQIVNVPVCFPVADVGGNKAMITLPMKAGDGVLLVFSQRSIENWLDGSKGSPDDPRMFDLSDAFAIPSCNAKSPAADAENLSIQYGSGSIKITPSGDVLIDSPNVTVKCPTTTFNGDIQLNGSMAASGDVSAGGISLQSHKHGGVQGGPSKTGGPE
ncbi:MAG: phage baseplate protein [Haemophilus parahaemolyticus]|uniref:Gp138 family membrane-puncturing spike protein n=1 Tax=Haemophilus parahaemolyticus TaxID=735 RepID=UPI0026F0F4A6|nr:Gp138 family membrane-puncturing spike protein [Haemophilus parahaemolyticus]MBS6009725.1 phage baseplate protein [Haemophilus parahaemolyticus]